MRGELWEKVLVISFEKSYSSNPLLFIIDPPTHFPLPQITESQTARRKHKKPPSLCWVSTEHENANAMSCHYPSHLLAVPLQKPNSRHFPSLVMAVLRALRSIVDLLKFSLSPATL